MILKSFPDTTTLDEVMKAAESFQEEVWIEYQAPNVNILMAGS